MAAPIAEAPDELRAMVQAAPIAEAPDELRAMIQAAQANIGAIQKRIDEVMIWR